MILVVVIWLNSLRIRLFNNDKYIIDFPSLTLILFSFYADCHSGRGILFYPPWKTWHALNYVFWGSYVLKYFIELKSINTKNSVFFSIYIYIFMYICHNFHLQIFPTSFCTSFVPSFLKIHISLNFRATIKLKTYLESLFCRLSYGYNFTAVNRLFRRWNRSETADFCIFLISKQGFWILMSPLIFGLEKS